MKTGGQINYVISIIGLGFALGALATVLEFPILLALGIGLGAGLFGILRAIGGIEHHPTQMNTRK